MVSEICFGFGSGMIEVEIVRVDEVHAALGGDAMVIERSESNPKEGRCGWWCINSDSGGHLGRHVSITDFLVFTTFFLFLCPRWKISNNIYILNISDLFYKNNIQMTFS